MKITEGQLRTIVKRLVEETSGGKRELAKLDKAAFNKAVSHLQKDEYFESDDPEDVGYAVKSALESLGGFVPQGGDRKEFEKNINSAEKAMSQSMVKNRAGQRKKGEQDAIKAASDQVLDKAKSAIGAALQLRFTRG